MKQNIIKKINHYITEKNIIKDNSLIIIGLSGGPDSVFLLHYLANVRREKNLTLIAAHLDHGWRPESAQDAQFCKELCNTYEVPLITKKMADLNFTIKNNGSQEEIGRKARRHFFESGAKEYNASAIALAHHADDQQETFFIRLIRGASLAGLTGMKSKDGLYIRPLLGVQKDKIVEYLDQNKIPYVIDASNQSDEYLRNRIRNTVIPALKIADDRFDTNFHTTHKQLQETEDFLQNLMLQNFAEIANNSAIKIDRLLAMHPMLRNRIVMHWLIANKIPFTPSQGLFDEIVRFLENPGNGKHVLHQKWHIAKKDNSATIMCVKQMDCL